MFPIFLCSSPGFTAKKPSQNFYVPEPCTRRSSSSSSSSSSSALEGLDHEIYRAFFTRFLHSRLSSSWWQSSLIAEWKITSAKSAMDWKLLAAPDISFTKLVASRLIFTLLVILYASATDPFPRSVDSHEFLQQQTKPKNSKLQCDDEQIPQIAEKIKMKIGCTT